MADCILLKGGSSGLDSDDFTATAAQVLQGYFAGVKGRDEAVEGTIPDKRGVPQKINYWRIQNNRFEVAVNKGYYEAAWDADCYEYMEFANVASCIGLSAAKLLKGQTVCGVAGSATGDATATAANILKDKTAYVNGVKVTGTLAVNSALSFSIAAISSTEIEIYWTNPAKGPFSGVFVQMDTSGYPGATGGTRKYTGIGTNSAAGGKSSCKITGLSPNTKYYFTVVSYCTGLGNGNAVNLTATTQKAQGTKIITSSGTFTVPTGVTSLDIFCVGGGGGGSGKINTDDTKSVIGGGGGGYVQTRKNLSVTPGESLNIVIGAGGLINFSGSDSNVSRGSTTLATASGGTASDRHWLDPRGATGGSGGGAGGGDANGSDKTDKGYAGAGGSDGEDGGSGSLVCESDSQDYTRTYVGGSSGPGTTRAFAETSGTLYAGGGGGCLLRRYSRDGSPVAGGAGGGGAGAVAHNSGSVAAVAGTANTGGGGGGGNGESYTAKGGSGVVIIRWGYT